MEIVGGSTAEDRAQDRALRQQAVKLTESTFLKISPRPLRPVEKVAPVVYALLVDGVPPETIAKALTIARSHTPDAIAYALTQIMPRSDPDRPRYEPYKPISYVPGDEERARVLGLIAATRAALRGDTT